MKKEDNFHERKERAIELISDEEVRSTQEERAISENGATLSVGENNFVAGVGSAAIGHGNFAQVGKAVNVLHTDFTTRTLTLEEAADFQVGEKVVLVPSSMEYGSIEATVVSWDAATKSLVLDQVGSGPSFLVKPGQGEGISETALAFGYKNIACGEYGSYAEGRGTLAAGATAHAEGGTTSALGAFSHAEGYLSKAAGSGSHAEGAATTASGFTSHAEGYLSETEGDNSHAEGTGTVTVGRAQHVEGEYNLPDAAESGAERSTYAHIVGNGTGESARSNAHTLDWDGNAWFAGDVTVGAEKIPLAPTKDAEFSGSFNINDGPVTIGTRADLYVPEGIQGLTLGEGNLADTRGSIAVGKNAYAVKGYCYKILAIDGTTVTVDHWDNRDGGSQKLIAFRAIGTQAPEEVEIVGYEDGNKLILNKELRGIFRNHGYLLHMNTPGTLIRDTSFAFGERVVASGDGALACGGGSVAEGNYSTATGYSTRAIKSHAHAEGYETEAGGVASHAEGLYSKSSGEGSHAEGSYTTAVGKSQHVEGEYNLLDTSEKAGERGTYVHIVGNGTSEDARSNAHTLDWDGNAWFAGDVTVGEDKVPLVTAKDANFSGSLNINDGPVTIGTRADVHVPVGVNGLSVGKENLVDSPIGIAVGEKAYAVGGNCYKILAIDGTKVKVDHVTNILGGSNKLLALRMRGNLSPIEVEIVGTNSKDTIELNQELPANYSNYGYLLHLDSVYQGGFAFGKRVIAAGTSSFACGRECIAEGVESMATGSGTRAMDNAAHAEGGYTTAKGSSSHAEGSHTTAAGSSSHAEGNQTVAIGRAQHVAGEYNLLDTAENASTRGVYAYIVGNGTSEDTRSNTHTLDWDGNA